MSRGFKILTIIVILITLVAIASVTYAYLTWSSPSSDVSLETENISLTVDGGADISGVSLVPVDDKSKGIIKDFTVTNDNDFDVYLSIDLELTSFDSALCDETFLYALYEVSGDNETLIYTDNFGLAVEGDTFNLGYGIELLSSETKSYRLYIWINGLVENPYEMMGKTFDINLTASATSKKPNISGQLINKTRINTNSINLGSYSEKGDFLVINRAPLGSSYQVNVQQYEYRYVGKTPSNYVWFNCSTLDTNSHTYGDDDYEYNTTNCEKWRIIGVFLTEVPVYDDDGNITSYKWQYLTKIIRNSTVAGAKFTDGYQTVNYATDNFIYLKTLNPGYEELGYSTYYNRSGNYSTTGMKDDAKNYIETVKWYRGYSSGSNYINDFYLSERKNSDIYSFWVGKIALMYPSDYGYNGGAGCSLDINSKLNSGNYKNCQNRWIVPSGYEQVFGFRGSSQGSLCAVTLSSDGHFPSHLGGDYGLGGRPTLYLKQETSIIGGEGTSESPYVLSSLND